SIPVLIHRTSTEIREVHAGAGDAVGALRRGRARFSRGGGGPLGTFSLVAPRRRRGAGNDARSDPSPLRGKDYRNATAILAECSTYIGRSVGTAAPVSRSARREHWS